ncbi:MAG: ATP-binding protein [Bdellovibrionales bacterium]
MTAALLFENNESRYLTTKSAQIADGLARSLRTEILNRTAVLKVLVAADGMINSAVFEKIAAAIVSEYPGIYAVNLVAPNGRITNVHPLEANRLALGQNLLNRQDVQEYLLSAKADREPRMSHKLMTYQGVPAFTLYVPLYSGHDQFIGWLNAVVDFDNWLAGFLKARALDHTRVVIKWQHPDSGIIDHGPKDVRSSFSYNHRLFNQSIRFEIGFAPNDLDSIRARHYMLVIVVGAGLLLLALMLILNLHLSKLRLMTANKNLALKNNLLSSLSHDLSGPLAALVMTLEQGLEDGGLLSPKQQRSVAHLMKSMTEMLKSAKILHAKDMGILKLKTESVQLATAVPEAILTVSAQAHKKNIQFVVADLPQDLAVLADKATLVNNVLLNVLVNAIKFSPDHGHIRIYAATKKSEVHLIVEDAGAGLSPDQLSQLQKFLRIESTTGTLGEQGTGLGLLQIQGFMNAYGGSMRIENCEKGGCRMILIFQRGGV